jgi:hypothetical protein
MLYQTIALDLLEQDPPLHNRLRRERKLLAAMTACAEELKRRHLAWTGRLKDSRPESHPSQLSTEALELALDELRASIQQEFPIDAL